MLELINVLVGGVSAAAALAALWFPYRDVSIAGTLRKKLSTVGTSDLKTFWDEDRVLVQYLDHAALMVGPLKRRVLERFVTVIAGLFTTSAFVYIDFPTELTAQIENLEWWDLLILAAQAFGAVVGSMTKLLTDEEKLFLINASRLHAWFYSDVVTSAMYRFNSEIASSEAFRRASWAKDDEEAWLRKQFGRPHMPIRNDPEGEANKPSLPPARESAPNKDEIVQADGGGVNTGQSGRPS